MPGHTVQDQAYGFKHMDDLMEHNAMETMQDSQHRDTGGGRGHGYTEHVLQGPPGGEEGGDTQGCPNVIGSLIL